MSLPRFAVVVALLGAMAWSGQTLLSSYRRGKMPNLVRTKNELQKSIMARVQEALPEAGVAPTKPAPVLSANLVDELAQYSQTAFLSRDRNVQTLLDSVNRNPEIIMARGYSPVRSQMIAGARAVVAVLARCLSDSSHCGNNESWDDYYAIGGAPLHQVLERAMAVLQLATDQGDKFLIDRETLLNAVRVPHHNISVTAVNLLTTGPLSSEEFSEILNTAPAVKGRAKKLYFQMLGQALRKGGSAEDRKVYVEALYSALEKSEDRWTREHVVSGLDRYGLSEDEFSQAVRLSCKNAKDASGENVRLHLADHLEGKARRSGMHISAKAICLNSDQPKFADR